MEALQEGMQKNEEIWNRICCCSMLNAPATEYQANNSSKLIEMSSIFIHTKKSRRKFGKRTIFKTHIFVFIVHLLYFELTKFVLYSFLLQFNWGHSLAGTTATTTTTTKPHTLTTEYIFLHFPFQYTLPYTTKNMLHFIFLLSIFLKSILLYIINNHIMYNAQALTLARRSHVYKTRIISAITPNIRYFSWTRAMCNRHRMHKSRCIASLSCAASRFDACTLPDKQTTTTNNGY